jgi:hypothetical protein
MSDSPKSTRPSFKRDEDGLIPGFPYKFTPEGRVDWLAIALTTPYLFVIRTKEPEVAKTQGKPIGECDLSLVPEKWLRIRQAGFNYLLNVRGYRSIQYHSLQTSDSRAAVVCEIELIGNYETDGLPVIASGVASASTRSMDKQMLPYLEAFAENRSFARCVKRALQINILSEDEVDAEALKQEEEDTPSAQPASADAWRRLEEVCTKRKHPIAFEALKARAVKHNAELTPDRQNERIQGDPSTWTGFDSVQPIDAWLLVGLIKKADEVAKKGAK